MLNTYTDANKETQSMLSDDISVTLDSRTQNPLYYNWKITRRRTKDYTYVGMDAATAKACMNAKRAMYLRTFYTWRFVNGRWMKNTDPASMYKQCAARVDTQHLAGSMWNVRIQVDETCVAYVVADALGSGILDPNAAVDAACNSAGWSYDE